MSPRTTRPKREQLKKQRLQLWHKASGQTELVRARLESIIQGEIGRYSPDALARNTLRRIFFRYDRRVKTLTSIFGFPPLRFLRGSDYTAFECADLERLCEGLKNLSVHADQLANAAAKTQRARLKIAASDALHGGRALRFLYKTVYTAWVWSRLIECELAEIKILTKVISARAYYGVLPCDVVATRLFELKERIRRQIFWGSPLTGKISDSRNCHGREVFRSSSEGQGLSQFFGSNRSL